MDTSCTKYLILNKVLILCHRENTIEPPYILLNDDFDVLAPWKISHPIFGSSTRTFVYFTALCFPIWFPMCLNIQPHSEKNSQFITSNLTLFVIWVFPISISMCFWFPWWFLSIFINYALSQHVIWPLFVEDFLIFDWPTNPISRRFCHHSCPQSPAKTIISISARKTLWNGPLNEQWVSAILPGIKRFESVIL